MDWCMIVGMAEQKVLSRLPSLGHRAAPPAPVSLSEINFLEYRLEVAESWPDSERKRAVIEATFLRLNALRQV